MGEFENITLSQRNQTQKAMYCMRPFMWNVQNGQIPRDRKRIHGYGELERGRKRESRLTGPGFLWGWINVYGNWILVTAAPLCTSNAHRIVHFKRVDYVICELHLKKTKLIQVDKLEKTKL